MSVLRRPGVVWLLGICLAAGSACALEPDAKPPQPGEIGWQRAVRLRTQLEAMPAEQRTAERYQEVMDAFRQVYRLDPNIARAPQAVAAVADLLVERGKLLHEDGAFHAAMLQYELLRKQYPHTDDAALALLLEAELCRDDLRDNGCARQKLSSVVVAFPNTSFSEQAELELKQLPAPKAGEHAYVTGAAEMDAAPLLPHVDAAPKLPPARPEIGAAPRLPPLHPRAESGPGPVNAPERVTNAAAPSPDLGRIPDAVEDAGGDAGGPVRITGMRHWSNATSTRIAIDLTGKVTYQAVRLKNPDRIYFDLHGAHLAAGTRGQVTEQVDDGYLSRIRSAQFKPDVVRVVLDVSDVLEYSAFLMPNPWRLIIDVHGAASGPKKTPMSAPAVPKQDAPLMAEAGAQENGRDGNADVAKLSTEPGRVAATRLPTSRPVVVGTEEEIPQPALVLAGVAKKAGKNGKAAPPIRIVIDAGHGGHDSGTLGPGGIEEKDVVLDVALRTGKLLHEKLGAEILYTRSDDTFVPLETRTAIANRAGADLFLSVHANSSDEDARGVEAYYLNATANARAVAIAERENNVAGHEVGQLSEMVRRISLKEWVEESREFAADVDAKLYGALKAGNPGLKDRGVKKAPFMVLIGAQMPAVLAEISFLTNKDDAKKLAKPAYRQKIAAALEAGVERYVRTRKPVVPRSRFQGTTEVAMAGERGGK